MKCSEKNLEIAKSELMQNTPETNNLLAEEAVALIKTADDLTPAIKRRLAESRQLAVNRLVALQSESVLMSTSGIGWFGRQIFTQWMQHRAMALVFAMMMVTFFAVQQFGLNDNIENSDAYLLAADLPPEAFADKGFNTWIVSARD